MEINETVSTSVSADDLTENVIHDEVCPFCQSAAAPIAVREQGNLKNNSTELGKAMVWVGSALDERASDRNPRVTIIYKSGEGGNDIMKKLVIAAHHLIPGNESLGRSDLCRHKALRTALTNAGYNVNCAENGLWVPSNTVEKGQQKWTSWTSEEQTNFATAAMKCVGTQFHDRHLTYSELVKAALNCISQKVHVRTDGTKCPRVDGQPSQPLTALVRRLHGLSSRLGSFVSKPAFWRPNVFLSRFAKDLIDKSIENRRSSHDAPRIEKKDDALHYEGT